MVQQADAAALLGRLDMLALREMKINGPEGT